MNKINNLWLMHIFTPIQFGFFLWIFSHWQKKFTKYFFLALIPAFSIFWLVAMLFFESFNNFNSYTRPLEALLLILISGYTLYQINKEQIGSMFQTPSFWISSGTLVYFSGMILLYALSNILLTDSIETLRLLWAPIQTTVNVMSNLLFIGGFLCLSPRLHPQQ